ncbi:MAG: hypothetical protein AAGA23_13705 [Pseudomonadota bacterium]
MSDRFLEVGWVMDPVKASTIWYSPEALDLPVLDDPSAKAVTACPAVLQHEARVYQIRCPIDAQFSAGIRPDGTLQFNNELGHDSPIDVNFLDELIVPMPPDQWRDPKRPIFQIVTPYRFVCDDYCFIEETPPFHDYKGDRWPGLIISGRFQANVWPRRLMWAFEWHDMKKPLVLKRGEPWFYVRFEGRDPAMSNRLVEAQWTPELKEYVDGIDTVTNYVKKTFSLFKTAEERRPETLLKRRQR